MLHSTFLFYFAYCIDCEQLLSQFHFAVSKVSLVDRGWPEFHFVRGEMGFVHLLKFFFSSLACWAVFI